MCGSTEHHPPRRHTSSQVVHRAPQTMTCTQQGVTAPYHARCSTALPLPNRNPSSSPQDHTRLLGGHVRWLHHTTTHQNRKKKTRATNSHSHQNQPDSHHTCKPPRGMCLGVIPLGVILTSTARTVGTLQWRQRDMQKRSRSHLHHRWSHPTS